MREHKKKNEKRKRSEEQATDQKVAGEKEHMVVILFMFHSVI